MEKSMPPAFSTFWFSRLRPFLEPRALPSCTIIPSSTATTGFTLSSVPTAPAAADRRPPRTRYSSVSSRPMTTTRSRTASTAAAIWAALRPSSTKRSAYSTRTRSPRVTLLLSTTNTSPPGASASAVRALWLVPDSLAPTVIITASSPASRTSAMACENAYGLTWPVLGSSSRSTSIS